MSGVGRCADNAAAESFFTLLQRKQLQRKRHATGVQARADVLDAIECFRNPRRRRKLTLNRRAFCSFRNTRCCGFLWPVQINRRLRL
jgi:transposase InsO family protein